MIQMFNDFLVDSEAREMFITGSAGTGKTTALIEIAEELSSRDKTYMVTAFTNAATDVLASKLPDSSYTSTLHSFLKKRPTINRRANHRNVLTVNTIHGTPETIQVLIVDEFSFIGEQDYMDIGDIQDICLDCGYDIQDCKCTTPHYLKTIYVGDPNQLNPVNSYQAVVPSGEYHKHLTKIHRQSGDEDTNLVKLRELVESNSLELFTPVSTDFLEIARYTDYKRVVEEGIKYLAYTNKEVQRANALFKGRTKPEVGDSIYNSTMKLPGTITRMVPEEEVTSVTGVVGTIDRDSKYNPLKTVKSLKGIKFYEIDNSYIVASWFGSQTYNSYSRHYGDALVAKNKANKPSKKEYKYYKTVSDLVSQLDFPHASTIHKSQGQEYDTVAIAYDDLVANNKNITDINRLLYVAISRAKVKVIIIKKPL